MTLPRQARESRQSRVSGDMGGAWGSSSQDFLRLANVLFEKSAAYAKGVDGNCSVYTLAGIPMLLSALRCLLIELNAGMYSGSRSNTDVLADLASTSNDIKFVLEHYAVSAELKEQLQILFEVRNEIIHPAHRPAAERNNTPTYLSSLQQVGLLQSTGADTDYIWISQLQSHKLFTWAFTTISSTVDILLRAHQVPEFIANGLRESYSRYANGDL